MQSVVGGDADAAEMSATGLWATRRDRDMGPSTTRRRTGCRGRELGAGRTALCEGSGMQGRGDGGGDVVRGQRTRNRGCGRRRRRARREPNSEQRGHVRGARRGRETERARSASVWETNISWAAYGEEETSPLACISSAASPIRRPSHPAATPCCPVHPLPRPLCSSTDSRSCSVCSTPSCASPSLSSSPVDSGVRRYVPLFCGLSATSPPPQLRYVLALGFVVRLSAHRRAQRVLDVAAVELYSRPLPARRYVTRLCLTHMFVADHTYVSASLSDSRFSWADSPPLEERPSGCGPTG